MLEATGIHKTYTDGKSAYNVLRGIDLHIGEGAFVAVVGPSGAGKSTLLHILGGLDEPTQGKVIFEKYDIYNVPEQVIAGIRNKKFGFVFQFYHLLPEFTVLENVLIPALIARGRLRRTPDTQLREYALQFLERVGLGQRTQHFPSQLSGGEKQRVAIVRGLINQPRLLLCDEPTGNLDSHTGSQIIELIRQIHRQNRMSVVMVTHNAELTKGVDQVYHLQDGVFNPRT